jgi:hypothetical protein
MNFSPKLIFWVTFGCFIGNGIAGGTVHLTNMIPSEWIPTVMAWISFETFVGLGFLTVATGYAGVGKGPLAPPPTREEAQQIVGAVPMADMVKKPPAASVGAKQ